MPPRKAASRVAPSPARSTRSVQQEEGVRNDGLLGFKDTSVNIAAAFHAAQTRKARRAVSPVEQLAETARALSPVRFFLRPTEPEEEYSSFSTFEQPSYDYQQEEEWVRAVQAKGDGKRRKKVTEEDMPYRPGSDSGSDSDARKTPSPRKNSPTPVQHIVRAITPRMSPAPRTFQPRRKPSSSRTAVTNILHGIVLALQFVVDLLGNMAKAIVSPLAGGLRRLRRDWWKWVCGLFALSLALRLGKRRPEIDLDTRIAALERGVNRNVVVDHGITRDEVRAIVKQIQEESAQPVESRIDVEEVVRRILEDQPVKTTSTDTVQQLIDKSILRYSKDTLGLADYALFTAGGRVVPSITSDTLVLKPASAVAKWLGGARDVEGRSPATALHPDNSVGNCWPFRGSQGQLGVLLSRRAVVTSVTIEHAAQELALDVSTAPRFIEVWGLVESEDNHLLLANVTYDPAMVTPIQTFSVFPEVIQQRIDVGIVIFRVLDNWGGDLTCLYRVRVHGDAAEV